MPSAPRTPAEELEGLAHRAVEVTLRHRGTRGLLEGVRDELRRTIGADLKGEELEDAARNSLALRIIDILQVAPWTPEMDRAARYGRTDLPTPASISPLPRDRAACVETLTLREAYAARGYLLALPRNDEEEELPAGRVLDLTVWLVAELRLNDSGDAARPLDVEYLDELEHDTESLLTTTTLRPKTALLLAPSSPERTGHMARSRGPRRGAADAARQRSGRVQPSDQAFRSLGREREEEPSRSTHLPLTAFLPMGVGQAAG